MRKVVLLCGPPGAGKTTAAHASGLAVFDRDDARWSGERDFREALTKLGTHRGARAVVIRSGATSSARAKAAAMIGATHVFLVLAPPDELRRRIRSRARADMVTTLVAVGTWLDRFDRHDHAPNFPGWSLVDVDATEPGVTSQDW